MASPTQSIDAHVDSPTLRKPDAEPNFQYTYYHAGPLFTQGDLLTNVLLSRAISRLSNGKFVPILPQDLEQRGNVTPQNIRDKDIRALLGCDMALFTYDGAELDSGTVVEYMIAKFADIPSVILRSDFRGGGDQGSHPTGAGEPWNLMSSFWPRTKGVVIDGMGSYKTALTEVLAQRELAQLEKPEAAKTMDVSVLASEAMVEHTAQKCVDALEEVLAMPPRLPAELRQNVYQWLALMPRYADKADEADTERMSVCLRLKEEKGLFGQRQ